YGGTWARRVCPWFIDDSRECGHGSVAGATAGFKSFRPAQLRKLARQVPLTPSTKIPNGTLLIRYQLSVSGYLLRWPGGRGRRLGRRPDGPTAGRVDRTGAERVRSLINRAPVNRRGKPDAGRPTTDDRRRVSQSLKSPSSSPPPPPSGSPA